MGYGPTTLSNILLTDLVPPGAPALISVTQVSNTIIRCVLSMPTMDSINGQNLSGLKLISIATIAQTGTTNPFAGKTMSEILTMSGISKTDLSLSSADAGLTKSIDVPIVAPLNSTQALVFSCSD